MYPHQIKQTDKLPQQQEHKSPLGIAASKKAGQRPAPRQSRSKVCDHGLIPDYCAHCKFGALIDR